MNNIYIVKPRGTKPAAYTREALTLLSSVLGGQELLTWADEEVEGNKEDKTVSVATDEGNTPRMIVIATISESILHHGLTRSSEERNGGTRSQSQPTQNSESTSKTCKKDAPVSLPTATMVRVEAQPPVNL